MVSTQIREWYFSENYILKVSWSFVSHNFQIFIHIKYWSLQVEDPQLTKPFLEREDAVKESRSLTPNPTRRTKSTDEERNESQFGSRSTNQFFKLQKLLTLIDKNMTVVCVSTKVWILFWHLLQNSDDGNDGYWILDSLGSICKSLYLGDGNRAKGKKYKFCEFCKM